MVWIFTELNQQKFVKFLWELLSAEHQTALFDEKDAILPENTEAIISTIIPKRIDCDCVVYLSTGRKQNVEIPREAKIICPDNLPVAPNGAEYYPCGYAADACMTVSASGDGKTVISLLRAVKSFSGRMIEPFDFPAETVEGISEQQLLFGYLTKLLLY